MDTKQKILDVSLKLFSENGFEAVSIRQICSYVKIKESSIYHFFKNKRAILDEFIDTFEKRNEEMMNIFTQRWLLSGKLTNYKKENFRLNAYKNIQYFFNELNIKGGL